MKAYKGTFDAATSTGNQAITGIVDEDGNAFTPKAVLIWSAGTFAAGFADGLEYQIGFADGTNQSSVEYAGNDNSATSNANCQHSGSAVARLLTQPSTIRRSGAFNGFASGQFTINWTTVTANTEKFHYIAFGGDDLSALVNRQRMDSIRSAVATPPVKVIITSCGQTNSGGGGIAFAVVNDDGTVTQGLSIPSVRDGVNPSQTRRLQQTDIFRFHPTTSFGTFIAGAWDGRGPAFSTLNTSSGVISADLILGGIAAKGGADVQPVAPGAQAISGLGFAPKAVLILSHGRVAGGGFQNEAQLCVGGADRTRQGYIVTGAVNGVTPSVSVKKSDESNIVCGITPNATAASSTTEAEASIALDADGFTLTWGAADATQRQFLWLAFGDEPAVGGGGGEHSTTFVGYC